MDSCEIKLLDELTILIVLLALSLVWDVVSRFSLSS